MIQRASKFVIAGAILLSATSLGGCATKKFVNQEVGVVQTQVAAQDARLSGVDATAKEALGRAEAAGKLAEGKFVYSAMLSDDSLKFPAGKATLSPEATARLDAFVEKLKTENRNVYVEIQGHTDARGDDLYNDHLGEERAEAVRRFLAKQGVALNRIGVISYGADNPVQPETDPASRQANRRVVLVVLA